MTENNVLHAKLESARRELLDLTTRNRLLSTSRSATRSGRLEIVDELSEEVFRILVRDTKAMTFKPGHEDDKKNDASDEASLALTQPEDDEVDENGVATRHTDHQLQTRLSSEGLQRRLLTLFRDARTFEEEQGVNSLYLALGFLKWFEDDRSEKERYAPLLLIPVVLDRRSATSRFQLQFMEDELNTNLSLQEKLRADFGVRLPAVPDIEDLSPSSYFAEVTGTIAAKPRWEVLPNDIVLWFFSFSKFLMYRDLQPETWPTERSLDGHRLVTSLLRDGFRSEPPLCGDGDNIDRLLQPRDLVHVMDADSSQTVAIEEVKRGRNLVVQGPPGTGKSQTIANMIAAAVKEGRKVLFVAEKMAALEVVKRRLGNAGLGDMCLELHSHKANKRAVLEELDRTLHLGQPQIGELQHHAADLQLHRDRLNRHVAIMHEFLEPGQVTPFQAIGELVRLRAAGVPPANFQLVEPLTWTATDVREKCSVLHDLASHLQEIQHPPKHPWRGVQLEAVLPNDIDRWVAGFPSLQERIGQLAAHTQQLADCLNYGTARTPFDSGMVGRLGKRVVNAPAMDRTSLANDVWTRQRADIDALIQTGQTLATSRKALEGVVADVAWTTNVAQARGNLAAYGRSWFRIFRRNYREAQATLRSILTGLPPKRLDDQLQILDRLLEGQQARQKILADDQGQAIGRRAFGQFWQGLDSDWQALAAISAWEVECRGAEIPPNFRDVAATVTDLSPIRTLVTRIAQDLKPVLDELKQLFVQLKLDLLSAFGQRDMRTIGFAQLSQRLSLWQSQTEGLTKWIAYFTRWKKLAAEGMGMLAEQLDQGLISAEAAVDRFRSAYFEEIMRESFQRHRELAEFDGASHERVLDKFRQLDKEQLRLAGQEVALAHYRGLPTNGGDLGEVGYIRREIKKKRRHLALRKLLAQAGHAIQAIKPVFMMSPISVAQYLEPGVLEFDLLLIDEASQVRPVEALGAIARARQIAVVGDDRQLPPTMFFSRLTGDDDEDADAEEFQAADLESILGLCEAQSMPQRMLQWHYRSRHHSLIAVSNREFYDSRLFVVPSPMQNSETLGLRFHHVADGVFDRGGSRVNRVEARRVADAVLAHARQFPDKTLGVNAFSVAQRDAVLDELELRRRENPTLEPFFAAATAEPFFVKNLENIQGDERDVIFISVGYGKSASGFMAMSFGPLNSDGGERRLNVLITRARERCDVFSSIVADDIDLHRTKARGVQALKTFLTYAASGILDVAAASERECDSEFELEVAKAIVAQGYQVDTQVGVAGFWIDLAVVDPDCPGRYLLGVECDGATYHSSRSARDRDRLRQYVLEDRGWIIHRIWSTDWFHRPDEQLRKVLAAIERAKAAWARQGNGRCPTQPPAELPKQDTIERRANPQGEQESARSTLTRPYEEADFPIQVTGEIHELPVAELANIVTGIVKIEGPVHQDEVARRIASLWGLKRAGARISDAVEAALAEATHHRQVVQTGLFFQMAGERDVAVRNREQVKSTNLRKPDYLPPVEIAAALVAVVRTNLGVPMDEAITEVTRLFGFKATSAQLRQVVQDEMSLLTEQETLEQRNGKLYVVQASNHVHA